MFHKCMNRAVDEFVETIDAVVKNEELESKRIDIFYKLVIAIHFLIDSYDRLPNKPGWKDESPFVSAFKYVNNQLKHDVDLDLFYITICNGGMFPMRFPMHYGKPSISWANFQDNSDEKSKFRRPHYDNELMNKDVKSTILDFQRIIENLSKESIL